MLKVALTGSIASGKSLFASFLARRGAVVIDADSVGHDVIRKNGPAYAGVLAEFGRSILDQAGEIDRGVLGGLVFQDPGARLRLNRLVHPALIDEIGRRVARARASGSRVVVVDAALIYELGLDDEFDVVVAVTSPPELQIERLKSRGIPEEDARRRIAAQLPATLKAGRADLNVVNAGSKEDLEQEAERIWNVLVSRVELKTGPLFHRKESDS